MKDSREGEELDEANIIGWVKKNDRKTKNERLEKVLEGRQGRSKFGTPKQKGGGTSNKKKLKLKPFNTTKFSSKVSQKLTASMEDKSKKRGEHLQYIKKQGKRSNKNKRRKINRT